MLTQRVGKKCLIQDCGRRTLEMQLKNYAAWILHEKAQLEVAKAPLPECGENDLIVQTHHMAVNPVDWKIQDSGGFGTQVSHHSRRRSRRRGPGSRQ